ncbi:hypothetical protein PR048_024585 [Dryococelus australis]|uniref:PiggyBac transposable element-derived protein domain-containing protein n=1 Tax=Dryococelus australis TaxID=614101 RepID=A0ABQ9GP11_9NEOP|nr:hypothetical protein PR048_024585 [Dryococelus australis]
MPAFRYEIDTYSRNGNSEYIMPTMVVGNIRAHNLHRILNIEVTYHLTRTQVAGIQDKAKRSPYKVRRWVPPLTYNQQSRRAAVIQWSNHPPSTKAGFLQAGFEPDNAAAGRDFSGISRFHSPCIPPLFHIHFISSPSSARKTSLLARVESEQRRSTISDPQYCDALQCDAMSGSQSGRRSCPSECVSVECVSLYVASEFSSHILFILPCLSSTHLKRTVSILLACLLLHLNDDLLNDDPQTASVTDRSSFNCETVISVARTHLTVRVVLHFCRAQFQLYCTAGVKVGPTIPISHAAKTEMKALLGHQILSGLFKSNHEDVELLFAADGTGRDTFRATVLLRRFLILLAAHRFDDVTTREERKSIDRLAPISDLFNELLVNCQSNYCCGEYLTVDEMLCLSEIHKQNQDQGLQKEDGVISAPGRWTRNMQGGVASATTQYVLSMPTNQLSASTAFLSSLMVNGISISATVLAASAYKVNGELLMENHKPLLVLLYWIEPQTACSAIASDVNGNLNYSSTRVFAEVSRCPLNKRARRVQRVFLCLQLRTDMKSITLSVVEPVLVSGTLGPPVPREESTTRCTAKHVSSEPIS